jgi:hypothetical protein
MGDERERDQQGCNDLFQLRDPGVVVARREMRPRSYL